MVASWRANRATEPRFTRLVRPDSACDQLRTISSAPAIPHSLDRVSIRTGTSFVASSMRRTSSSEVAVSIPSWARPSKSRAR